MAGSGRAPRRVRSARPRAIGSARNRPALGVRLRLEADDWLGRGPEPADKVPELHDTAGVSRRAAFGEQARPAQARILGEARFDDWSEGLEFRRLRTARAILVADGLEWLVQQAVLDPAVQRAPADTGPARRLGFIAAGLLQQLM